MPNAQHHTNPPTPASPLILSLVLFLSLSLPTSLSAQTPDSLLTPPPDSLAIPIDSLMTATGPAAPDSTPPEIPSWRTIPKTYPEIGIPAADPNLVKSRFYTATDLLAERHGSFLFDLGQSGWPDGWSPYGIAPYEVGLKLDGVPFDDPATGRPLFEILPLELLDNLKIEHGASGREVGVNAQSRPYAVTKPVNEIRYQSGQAGLAQVSVVHAQNRPAKYLGKGARMHALFRYSGRGSDGDYPNSKSSLRQWLGQLRFVRPGTSVEVRNLYTGLTSGAHDGVEMVGENPFSIFVRPGATVASSSAGRQIKRNDLSVRTSWEFTEGWKPFELLGYWTSHLGQYSNDDTLAVLNHRYGLRLRQRLPDLMPNSRLEATAEAYANRGVRCQSCMNAPGSYSWTSLALTDSVDLGPVDLEASFGMAGYTGLRPFGRAAVSFRMGRSIGYARSSIAGYARPPIVASWDSDLIDNRDYDLYPENKQLHVLGGMIEAGWLTASLEASVGVGNIRALEGPTIFGDYHVIRRQLSAAVGTRVRRSRGLWSQARFMVQDVDVTWESKAAGLSLVTMRAGLRYQLFQDDLDADVFVEARYYDPVQQLAFRPLDQYLIIAAPGRTNYNPGFDLSLYGTFQIREATVFLAFENALAGVSAANFLGRTNYGSAIVPGYPLPEQAFRFGVFWSFLN